jgi:hypothetical protein
MLVFLGFALVAFVAAVFAVGELLAAHFLTLAGE